MDLVYASTDEKKLGWVLKPDFLENLVTELNKEQDEVSLSREQLEAVLLFLNKKTASL